MGRGGERRKQFTSPYPLKVQACPPRNCRPVFWSKVSGQEEERDNLEFRNRLKCPKIKGKGANIFDGAFTYPLKVQACPPRNCRPVFWSKVSGQEEERDNLEFRNRLKCPKIKGKGANIFDGAFTYPLKVQTCPPLDCRPALQSKV